MKIIKNSSIEEWLFLEARYTNAGLKEPTYTAADWNEHYYNPIGQSLLLVHSALVGFCLFFVTASRLNI